MKTHSPGFLALVNDAKSRIRQIDIEAYQKMAANGEPHRLIDTREESEYAAGHAKGAIHLSKGIIERDIEAKVPDKSAKLILYCGGGFRSALAAGMKVIDTHHEMESNARVRAEMERLGGVVYKRFRVWQKAL